MHRERKTDRVRQRKTIYVHSVCVCENKMRSVRVCVLECMYCIYIYL